MTHPLYPLVYYAKVNVLTFVARRFLLQFGKFKAKVSLAIFFDTPGVSLQAEVHFQVLNVHCSSNSC